MVLRTTQPLTEMSTRNIFWCVNEAGAYSWQPYRLHVSIVMKSGSLNLLEPSGTLQDCNGIASPFTSVLQSKITPKFVYYNTKQYTNQRFTVSHTKELSKMVDHPRCCINPSIYHRQSIWRTVLQGNPLGKIYLRAFCTPQFGPKPLSHSYVAWQQL